MSFANNFFGTLAPENGGLRVRNYNVEHGAIAHIFCVLWAVYHACANCELSFADIADDLEKKLPLNKQKVPKAGVMDSVSNFFGTLGRKKGKTANKGSGDFDKFETDPTATVSGEKTSVSLSLSDRARNLPGSLPSSQQTGIFCGGQSKSANFLLTVQKKLGHKRCRILSRAPESVR